MFEPCSSKWGALWRLGSNTMEVLQAPLDKKKIELNDAYMSAWKVRGHLGEVTQTATMAIEG